MSTFRPAAGRPGAGAPASGLLGWSKTVDLGGRQVVVGLPMVGAAIAALGSMLDWFSFTGGSLGSFDIKSEFLLNPTSVSPSGPDIGLLVLAAAVGFVVLAVLGGRARERRGIGIAVVAIGALYVIQLSRYLGEFPATDRPGLFSTIGIGVYVTIAGGALMLLPPQADQR